MLEKELAMEVIEEDIAALESQSEAEEVMI